MIDYAREAILDLYDDFYEFDDIMDYDFDAAMEEGEGDAPAGNTGSGLSTGSSARAASGSTPNNTTSNNKPTQPTNNNDPSKTTNDNANLKSTTGFVEKLKKLKELLKELIEKAMSAFQQKMAQMDQDNLNKFIQAANNASAKNGFHEIPIENYRYNPGNFNKAIDGVKSEIQEVERNFERAVSIYERAKNNQNGVDELSRLSKDMEENIWAKVAAKVNINTTDGSDPKNILQGFQNMFRGEKDQFTINQNYVNKLMMYLGANDTYTRNLIAGTELTKKLVKTIDTRLDAIMKDPSTTAEINNEITKLATALNKFTSFTSRFWNTALRLLLECRINCKIVIQRAYNFNIGGLENKAQDKINAVKNKMNANKQESNTETTDENENTDNE